MLIILVKIKIYHFYISRGFHTERYIRYSHENYSNKYKIDSTQLTNTEIFAFIAVLVFNLLNRKLLFINRKVNRNC